MLSTWWVWVAGAVLLAILETLLPVSFFLGLAAGAMVMGILVLLGVSFGGSLAWQLAVFAAVSLAATVALRFVLGGARAETKTFTDDINQG